MALADTGFRPDQPWGFIIALSDGNEDRILFVYPTKEQTVERMASIEDAIESMQITRKTRKLQSWKENLRFGIPLQALGCILSPKIESSPIIDIKVDALRFSGYCFKISDDSPEVFTLAFVLAGHSPDDAVTTCATMAKELCGAVNSLEERSEYLKQEIATMQRIHENIDIDQSDNPDTGHLLPFEDCLRECTMLQSFQKIFEESFVLSNTAVSLHEYIQIPTTIRSQTTTFCTLLPKSYEELKKMVESIRPYHTLILVSHEDPSAEKLPMFRSFLDHYNPQKTIEEIQQDMGCRDHQMATFVRSIVSKRLAVISYPICIQNTYTVGVPNVCDFEVLASLYNDLFPDNSRVSTKSSRTPKKPQSSALAEIMEIISPVSTLADYLEIANKYNPRAANMETILFLIKTGLIIQLHTQIKIMQPANSWVQGKKVSNRLSPRIRTLVKHCSLSNEFKQYLLYLCTDMIEIPLTEQEIFDALGTFISLIRYFDNCDYLERIFHETKISQAEIARVLDLFSPILFVFETPAQIY